MLRLVWSGSAGPFFTLWRVLVKGAKPRTAEQDYLTSLVTSDLLDVSKSSVLVIGTELTSELRTGCRHAFDDAGSPLGKGTWRCPSHNPNAAGTRLRVPARLALGPAPAAWLLINGHRDVARAVKRSASQDSRSFSAALAMLVG